MSFLNFSENQFSVIWNTSEPIAISNLQITEKLELEHIRVKCYKRNAPAGSVKLQLFTNAGNLICESNTIQLSSIDANFIGFVRFDFQRNNIQIGDYVLKAVLSGYSRLADFNFFSMIYDFPVKIYPNAKKHFDEHSIAIEIFGRKQ